ncbi:RNA polymerase II elongation factor ELL-like [Thalassophryne amazonica]|uniref:RNA polymerase II elongation factor ELL-like n=1 Tax=Thalassophryne amazonica TaxID=390379 RepID=UPI001470BCE4|nr:RNA polymerase II elongation factor ELL-like [Thalassophryne amazonica]
MAVLRQEHSYGLSGAQISKNITNQSLYNIKLTDSAVQILETYQNLKTSLSNQPTICFKENQGYMKIPAPTPDAPDATEIIRFNMSSDGGENPQSSFECIHQYVSGEDRDHLESMGHIQGKMMACATEQSYQTIRGSLSQMEKANRKRSAIEIKWRPSMFGKVQRKQNLMPGSRSSSSSKRSQVLTPVAHRPLRERVVHRLALRPHKKSDLVLWLERERADSEDTAELTLVLEEVSNWNPAADCYCLKPELFTHIQRDWPGYKNEEKQLIDRLLSRKRPSHPDLSHNLNSKKQKTSVQPVPSQMPSHGVGTSGNPHISALSSAYLHKGHTGEKATVTLTSATPLPDYVNKYRTITSPEQRQKCEEEFDANYHEYQVIHDRIAAATEMFVQMSSQLDTLPPGTKLIRMKAAHLSDILTAFRLLNGTRNKPTLNFHLDFEPKRVWKQRATQEKATVTLTSATPLPDYVNKYSTITSPEQRQKCEEEFDANYHEYQVIHDRIAAATEMFVQMSSQLDTLPPGTEAYQRMQDDVVEKYRIYQKWFPGYREDKKNVCIFTINWRI